MNQDELNDLIQPALQEWASYGKPGNSHFCYLFADVLNTLLERAEKSAQNGTL